MIITGLLFKEASLEIFFKDNSLNHDKSLPEIDASQSHFRVCVLDSVNEDLEIEAAFISLDY